MAHRDCLLYCAIVTHLLTYLLIYLLIEECVMWSVCGCCDDSRSIR